MPRRQYNRALATYEHGTKIYAPTPGETRYRIITKDSAGKRITLRVATEAEARTQARALEAMLASSTVLPGRRGAAGTVGQLADRYLASLGARSTRYVERQEHLLRMWVRPLLDDHPLQAWTPADSDRVLDRARTTLAPATVQNLGAAMRALVTYAFKNRWLPREADPMWMVRYTPRPTTKAKPPASSPATISPPTNSAPPCSTRSPTKATPTGRSHAAQVPQLPPLGRAHRSPTLRHHLHTHALPLGSAPNRARAARPECVETRAMEPAVTPCPYVVAGADATVDPPKRPPHLRATWH